MSHLLILPILLPLFCGALLLLLGSRLGEAGQRGLSLLSVLGQLIVAVLLVRQAGAGELALYVLGNWQPPFGIVLLLDRLAALMLLVSGVLALFALLYALRGDDRRGQSFHALFQFQLLGINGAFLTGDLFNLFVFFEILLLASYALLLHGGGGERIRAGLHYVVLNLVGSSLFLIALGLLYGIAGTLNMADLARAVGQADTDQAALLASAGMLLLVVFGLKAALFPLCFWLPQAYSAASAPVAALFAIMTKIGVYAILRVSLLVFGERAGLLVHLGQDWLWWLALLTIVLAGMGALGAASLQRLAAWLVLMSAGTLLAGVALGSAPAISATLYYLIHSSWIAGAMFLVADLITRQRGTRAGLLVQGPALMHPQLLGGLFFITAIGIAGLPPLSGFFGKLMLLQAVPPGLTALWLWPLLLLGSLAAMVALSRAGSMLFWKVGRDMLGSAELDTGRLLAALGLLAATLLLVLAAHPVQQYLMDTARQLLSTPAYLALIPGGAS